MFGLGCRKRRVRITCSKPIEGGGSQSFIEDTLTKKELLRQVGEWWDNHGTGFNDYDAIQLKLVSPKEM